MALLHTPRARRCLHEPDCHCPCRNCQPVTKHQRFQHRHCPGSKQTHTGASSTNQHHGLCHSTRMGTAPATDASPLGLILAPFLGCPAALLAATAPRSSTWSHNTTSSAKPIYMCVNPEDGEKKSLVCVCVCVCKIDYSAWKQTKPTPVPGTVAQLNPQDFEVNLKVAVGKYNLKVISCSARSSYVFRSSEFGSSLSILWLCTKKLQHIISTYGRM